MPALRRIAHLGFLVFAAAAFVSAEAYGEVLYRDASLEISADGARKARSCEVLFIPAETFGERPPRLAISLSASKIDDMAIEVGDRSLDRDIELLQDNLRREIASVESSRPEEFSHSAIAMALRSGKLFFLTGKATATGDYASTRFEAIDFDSALMRIGHECPFDAEAFLSDTAPRLEEERSLGLTGAQMSAIRSILGGEPGGRGPLEDDERDRLRRFTIDQGFPISRFLTRAVVDELLQAASADTGEMESRTRDVVRRSQLAVSGPVDALFDEISKLYAPRVDFYGQQFSVHQIISDKQNIAARWPQRDYRAPDAEMEVQCDVAAKICAVRAMVYWSVSSVARNKRSNGISIADIRVDFSLGRPVIVYENGETLVRN